MYSNILLPVSFEEGRDVAGSLAVAKALRAPGGKITCLHVVEALPQYATEFVPSGHIEAARADISSELEALIADVPDAQAVVVDGSSANAILTFAQDNGKDLIIIASHRPGMTDYLLGSTAARVVRHAKCSVHVIR